MSCGVLAPLVKERQKPRADIPIPDSWAHRLKNGSDAQNWVRRFNDSTLTKIVDEALQNNNTLQAAAISINQLKAAELLTDRSQRPNINGNFGASNSGFLNDFNASESTNYSLSFNTGWEADLWGRLKDQREQSSYNTLAAKADYFAARLSIAANTTSAYFNYITAQNSLSLAEKTLVNFTNSNKITERNYKAGVDGVDSLDVQFGRNNVTSAKRTLSQAKLNLASASQSLEILLGRYPQGSIKTDQALPSPLTSLPKTLPAGVVEQRPDLIAARADLSALSKEIDIRQKNLLPSINLSGNVSGDSSTNLSRVLDPAFLGWSIASSLTQPIFDSGQRKLQIEQTQAQYGAAIKNYTQDALLAFRDIEFALLSEKSIAEQSALLKKEVSISTLAEKQAQRDYSEGISNNGILSVLEAQRRAVSARSDLIDIRNRRLQNQINLFTAIGGNP